MLLKKFKEKQEEKKRKKREEEIRATRYSGGAVLILIGLVSLVDSVYVMFFTFILAGIIALPIKAIDELFKKYLPKYTDIIKIAIGVVLVFTGIACAGIGEEKYYSSYEQIEELPSVEETEDRTGEAVVEPEETTVIEEEDIEEPVEPLVEESLSTEEGTFDFASVSAYSGAAYTVVNDNNPYFSDYDKGRTDAFETYSSLDSLGRCGVAYANICNEIMPIEERGAIGSVKPTGWHLVKYNDIIDGNYLYNRCHLIGYQLAGENANEKNLITGTRYLNVEGMLPFENMVADFVKETDCHVLYRVTPYFEGDNLLATGVLMEAYSVEDNGAGICFNVFCYNVQPGVTIDYSNGDSALNGELASSAGASSSKTTSSSSSSSTIYSSSSDSSSSSSTSAASDYSEASSSVIVPKTEDTLGNLVWVPTHGGKKYHSNSSCSGMEDPMQVTMEHAEANGYTPCKRCY